MGFGDFRSVILPYCLKKIGKNEYIVLNREYKFVGFKTRKQVVYEEYPIILKIKGLTTKKIKEISWAGDPSDEMIFLYNDGCVPTVKQEFMDKYLNRLQILSKLRIE